MIGVAGPELSAKFFKISKRRSLMVHVAVEQGMMKIEPDVFGDSTKTPAYDLGFLIRLVPAGLYFANFEIDGWFKLAKFNGGYQACYVGHDDGYALKGWNFQSEQPEDAVIQLLIKLYEHDVEGFFRG